MTDDLFRVRLEQMIDLKHPLAVLGNRMPWGQIEAALAPSFIRYNERSTAERSNARLKDEFGGNHLMVRGAAKVMNHLMFGVLVLSANQLIRLRQ